VCVNIEYRSTFVIYRRDAAPTLSGFTEIVGDRFPSISRGPNAPEINPGM